MIIVDIVFFLVLFVLSFFSLQLLLGLKRSTTETTQETKRGKCVILMPAHNERAGIVNAIQSGLQEIQKGDVILVVADNCSDDTAELSRANGAMCIERQNQINMGKGHALQFGIDYIKQMDEAFETVVVMDADCLFEKGSLNKLLQASQSGNCVTQALYLMKSPNKDNTKLNISEFTWLIKNWVRPLGQRKLGISCHLQGSGMAFPISTFSKYSLASSSIVEDLELGLNIVKGGDTINFVENAQVTSYFPENEEGLEIQRKRWEHGHLSVVSKMPKTMLKSFVNLNFRLFFQALDAAIPPTIMWILFTGLMFVASIIYGFIYSFNWAIIYLIAMGVFALALVLCWFTYGRNILTSSQLKGLLPFILSKFSVYRSFMSNREKNWVRTKRDDE